MGKALVMSLFILTAGCLVSQNKVEKSNILWERNCSSFKVADWTVKDLSIEISNAAIRLRETGDGAEGSMSCEIKYTPEAKFVQVKTGIAENADNTFYLASGNVRYKLFTGWNTFPINSQDVKSGLLKITIVQKGIPGNNPGGWADIENIRVVESPADGLTVTLLDNGRNDNMARIGDTIEFRYYPSGSIMETVLEADCFVVPEMSSYRFSGQSIVLKKIDNRLFSYKVKIDRDAYSFATSNGKALLASVFAGNTFSYAYADFNVNINSGNAIPQSVFKGANPDIVKYRKMWAEYTNGKDLALGKEVIFSKKPDYALTSKGGTDSKDLTDGKLSGRKCDTIWFDPAAVGWYMSGAESGVNCLIDLGSEQPVSNVAIRALAGKSQTNLTAPAGFKIFVSKDGKAFYEAASMVKLMQAEKELSNFKTHYYIDELGKAYTFPFNLEVNASARYVGIYIKGATAAVFCDEIAIMEGNPKTAGFNDAYKGQEQKFITSGILVEPRLKELAISTNIETPNALQISDMREAEAALKPAFAVIDVPEGISIIQPEAQKESVEINGNKYTRWKLPLRKKAWTTCPQTEMLFLSADKSADVKLPAYTYAEYDGITSEKAEIPIRLFEIPEVKPELKRLHISLAWMSERDQAEYPNYLKAWKLMGFNAISCFPRNWQNGPESKKQEMLKSLDSARKEGFAIVMNESPFHVMEKGHKEGSEIFSQLKSGKKSKNLCPSYRGDFYWKEMDRVAQGVSLTKPDYVYWDIECWYPGAKEAPLCTRCIAEQEKSGKPMDDFLKGLGTENMKNLKAAVKKGIGNGKMPLVHCYDTHPTSPNYNAIMDFNRFYPEYVDTSANSFYVAGNALKVHDEMRENYKTMKNNKCIPWLTAGCYGEYEPYKLEQMILEALLNGACGITYYCYSDFDTSRDFYYHVKAVSEIAPYENIIMDGEVLTSLKGSNKNLVYSAVKKGKEMLLLVGNYKRSADGKSEIKLPFDGILEIKDLRNDGKEMKCENPFKIDVPKDQIVLYYIKGK
ncbi:MAG: hypothetical protein A2020_10485 [Lentisphaerae bacterium GWF2_45_14]|nr:MAG: hypothetical protein A2020_10485 [Lentisphaerae bacterium GWF2_45_14]